MDNINSLPIDCLISIFEHFPLQQRVNQLRLVCSHWRDVIEQRICARKTSLKLFGSARNITDYCLTLICDNSEESESLKLKGIGPKDDEFVLDTLRYSDELEIYDFLIRLFSNVKHLTVHFYRDTCFDHLDLFLEQCPTLTHLTLCGSIVHQNVQYTIELCETINQISTLKRLDLLTTDLFLSGDRESSLPIDMPELLFQLEHFSLVNYKGNLHNVISQFCGGNLKHLRLDLSRDNQSAMQLVRLIEKNNFHLSGVTHLRLSLPNLGQMSGRLMKAICVCFKLLHHLDIQCCSFVNFDMVIIDCNFIAQLNQLEHLTELRMSHVGIDLNLVTEESDDKIPKLPNIKSLHLSQVNTCPMLLESSNSLYIQITTDENVWRTISMIFPNVEQIYIRARDEAIEKITEHLKAYFKKLIKSRVYSAEEMLGKYFGRHERYNMQEHDIIGDCYNAEGFFSESYFDRIKDL